MTTYRITVDRKLCSGFASCVELAPHLFRLESDGLAATVVAETDDPAAIDAMSQCPMAAIDVAEATASNREAA
ncbi:MAG TPA: ferredoxin [Gaiellaceae bacterium]